MALAALVTLAGAASIGCSGEDGSQPRTQYKIADSDDSDFVAGKHAAFNKEPLPTDANENFIDGYNSGEGRLGFYTYVKGKILPDDASVHAQDGYKVGKKAEASYFSNFTLAFNGHPKPDLKHDEWFGPFTESGYQDGLDALVEYEKSGREGDPPMAIDYYRRYIKDWFGNSPTY